MTGREERMIRLEKQNQAQIQRYPQLLQNFYYSMSNLSPTTKNQYVAQIHLCFKGIFGDGYTDEDILSVNKDTINKYLTSRNLEVKESIINGQLYALNKLYNYLLDIEKIATNPVNVKKNRPVVPPKERIVYLTAEEGKAVIEAIKQGVGSHKAMSKQQKWTSRDLAMFVLFYCKGMRLSALTDINVQDVDLKKHELRVVDKRKKSTTFPLTEEDELILKELFADRTQMLEESNVQTDALFLTRSKGTLCRITGAGVRQCIQKYTAAIGKEVSPHKLRSSFGTQFYEMSEDLALTQEAMGHASIETTRRYVAVNTKRRNNYMAQISKEMLKRS